MSCQHKRYTVDTHEQTGRCHDCGAEGRMQFVVGNPPLVLACNDKLGRVAEAKGKTMSTVRIQFKNPDAIWEIINARHPLPEDEDDITPRMEKEREAFSDEYFVEYGYYGVIEIDAATLACRLVPRKEWKA